MEFQRHGGFSITIKLTTWLLLIAAVSVTQTRAVRAVRRHSPYEEKTKYGKPVGEIKYASPSCRAHVSSLTEFGGVGDGTTLNTDAFRSAINHLSQYASTGGGMLYVPAGKWLTGPFNLTSYFTLFLDKDATILGTQDVTQWPLIDPLPSYGRGRDKPGGRYSSLIGGSNLTDVVITGNNGTIDGQGASWWQKFHKNELKYTRGYLIELLYSDQILISNLTLVNSPAWNIHPVYSRHYNSRSVRSPNTDGINPDSCSQVKIEDCYVVSGDDCVAIKSGWDEYGIAVGMPSQQITIKRLTCISPTSAVIALGSEMSGGIQDVRAEDITAINSESGVRIKTAPGRGAYVKDIYVRGMNLNTMKWAFWMTGNYKSHPDDKFDPNAMPEVTRISYSDVVATQVTTAARLEGIPNDAFTGICISNVTVGMAKSKKYSWTCTDVEGVSSDVSPQPCEPLQGKHDGACPFPTEPLAIESIKFAQCTYALPSESECSSSDLCSAALCTAGCEPLDHLKIRASTDPEMN